MVGIVGYCDPKFDHALAKQYLITEFDKLKEESQRLNTQVRLSFVLLYLRPRCSVKLMIDTFYR